MCRCVDVYMCIYVYAYGFMQVYVYIYIYIHTGIVFAKVSTASQRALTVVFSDVALLQVFMYIYIHPSMHT